MAKEQRTHKNESKIIVVRPSDRFTRIPNSLIENNKLTPEEKFFLIFVCSRKPDFVFYKMNMHKLMGIKQGSLDRVWKSLIKKGHIVSERKRFKTDEQKGQFEGWQHTIIIELAD